MRKNTWQYDATDEYKACEDLYHWPNNNNMMPGACYPHVRTKPFQNYNK